MPSLPKLTYFQLVGDPQRVAPHDDPDRHYAYTKEIATAEVLRVRLGIRLRSVLRLDSREGLRNPDAVWDDVLATVDIKHPEVIKPSTWGKLLGDAIRKADMAVLDVRHLMITDAQARSVIERAMGGHGRGRRVDHVLILGQTQSTLWHLWPKGDPR